MAAFRLLAIRPSPKTPYGGVNSLVDTWVSAYGEAGVSHCPSPGDLPSADLSKYTHLWVPGTASELGQVSAFLKAQKTPLPLSYSYLFSDSPFVKPETTSFVEGFDFNVTHSEHISTAYKLAAFDNQPSPQTFKAYQNLKVIPLGQPLAQFFTTQEILPIPRRDELRNVLFGEAVSNRDFIVLVTADTTRRSAGEIPTSDIVTKGGLTIALETLYHLKKHIPNAKMVFHLPGDLDLQTYCDGIGLEYGKDVFEEPREFPPNHLRYLYRACDIAFFPVANTLTYTQAIECMANLLPVVVPDDHIWTDLLTESGVAIAVPASGFSKAPWDPTSFCRTINPMEAAEAIAKAKDASTFTEIPELAFNFIKDKGYDLDTCSRRWLKLFGII